MSARLLVAVAVVLVTALLWIGLRDAAQARAPIAAPGPEPTPPTQRPTELDRPETVSIDATKAPATVADAAPTQAHASARANASATIVLYGTVIRPPSTDNTDEETYVGATDHFGASAGAQASADGAYSISGLAPGHCWVEASSSAPASAASRAHVELELALIDSPKRLDILLESTPAVLVKVVDREGTPVLTPGLLAVATVDDPGDWFDEMEDHCLNVGGLGGFRRGRYTGGSFPDGFLGRILLEKPPPVLVSLLYAQRVIDTRRVERGQTQIVFTIDARAVETCSVRVRLVDEHGVAPTNAIVNLEGETPHPMQADGDGWVAKYLMPGKYVLRPRAKGLEMPSVPVVVTQGTDADLGTIVLAPEQSISGKVHFAGDEDRSGTWLRCDECEADGSIHPTRTTYMLEIQPDGSFLIRNLSRSLYLLQVSEREHKCGAWARIIDTRNGPVTNIDIVLVRGVPLVLRPSKKGDLPIRFRIIDSERMPIVTSRLYQDSPRPILLAPGKYDVEVVEPQVARKHVTIASEPVELALP